MNPAIPTFALVGTIIGWLCLTAVFGMGTGVSTTIWSPEGTLSDVGATESSKELRKTCRPYEAQFGLVEVFAYWQHVRWFVENLVNRHLVFKWAQRVSVEYKWSSFRPLVPVS